MRLRCKSNKVKKIIQLDAELHKIRIFPMVLYVKQKESNLREYLGLPLQSVWLFVLNGDIRNDL